MRSRGDKPFEIIFDPEHDKILVCAELARPIVCTHERHPHTGNCTAEGLAMPYDATNQVMSIEHAQAHVGTWRVEVYAPSRRAAMQCAHEQMKKRRAVTLLETR